MDGWQESLTHAAHAPGALGVCPKLVDFLQASEPILDGRVVPLFSVSLVRTAWRACLSTFASVAYGCDFHGDPDKQCRSVLLFFVPGHFVLSLSIRSMALDSKMTGAHTPVAQTPPFPNHRVFAPTEHCDVDMQAICAGMCTVRSRPSSHRGWSRNMPSAYTRYRGHGLLTWHWDRLRYQAIKKYATNPTTDMKYNRRLRTAGQQASVTFVMAKRHPKDAGSRPGVSPGAPSLQQHSAHSTLPMPSFSSRRTLGSAFAGPAKKSIAGESARLQPFVVSDV